MDLLEGSQRQLALSLISVTVDRAGGELFVVQKVIQAICSTLLLDKNKGTRGWILQEDVEDSLLLLIVLHEDNILLYK